MKNKNSLKLGLMLLGAIGITQLVLAAPTSPPPGGNSTSAQFNSVSAGYNGVAPAGDGGVFKGTLHGLEGIATTAAGTAGRFQYSGTPTNYVDLASPTTGLSVNKGSGSTNTNFAVGFDGLISNPGTTSNAGAVTIADDQGLSLFGNTLAADPVFSIVPNGSLAELNSSANVVLNMANGNGTLFFYDGIGQSTIGINQYGMWDGYRDPTTMIGRPLTIGDNDGLLVANGGSSTGLLITPKDISNTGGANGGAVTIKDKDGLIFQDGTGSTTLRIKPDGTMDNPSSIPGGTRPPIQNSVNIDDSIYVNGTVNAEGGIGGDSGSFGEVLAGSDLRVSHIYPYGYDLATRFDNGAVEIASTATGTSVTNINLAKDGHVKAVKGYGTIYTKLGPVPADGSIPASGFGVAPVVSCNNATDRMLTCGLDYLTSGNVVAAGEDMGDVTASSTQDSSVTSCVVHAHNNGTTTTKARAYATCFNPNGATW